jgi:UDP-N-acetyl-D-glucosamine dehydrogenase
MDKIRHMHEETIQTVAIIGQGYVGLPLAMEAVDAGWKVIGIDNSESKVSLINNGKSPIEDVSDERLMSALKRGLYQASVDFSMVAHAGVITICVPTPLDEGREPDLSLLRRAVSDFAPFVENETLIVSESTSYPGTLRKEIIPLVESLKPMDSLVLYYASAPERVNPGDKIWNQKNTPRLVAGVDEKSKIKALQFYKSISEAIVPVSSPEVAEAAKLLENTFRLVNIALVNQFAQICSANNVNVNEVIDAASTKPYGFMGFRPGVGVGGHCIPVDPLYLTWWARQSGKSISLVDSADRINRDMPKYVAEMALNLIVPAHAAPRVLILGIAYKPGVGDVRETPALDLVDHLETLGAQVAWHDPLVRDWRGEQSVDLTWNCDIAILVTKHPEMHFDELITRGVTILDCTNSIYGPENVEHL